MMLQIRLWAISYEVWGLVATKLSWVDPASVAAMESDAHLPYHIRLSGKSLDFTFQLGSTLNTHRYGSECCTITGHRFDASCVVVGLCCPCDTSMALCKFMVTPARSSHRNFHFLQALIGVETQRNRWKLPSIHRWFTCINNVNWN